MNIEKFVGGKLYTFIEWAFKLTIWNLLTLLLVVIVSGIPLYVFYEIQDDYVINNVEIVNDDVVVSLNNETNHIVGKTISTFIVSEFSNDEKNIYFTIDEVKLTYPNKDFLKTIDNVYINENKELIIEGMHNEYNYGTIFDSSIEIASCNIDFNKDVIIKYENGLTLNYGNKIETKSTLAGVFMLIALVLAVFSFIPGFVTTFSMIKIYAEDGSAPILLYFDRLWDNFKSLYKLELIIIPMLSIMSFALYFYYTILTQLEEGNFFISMSYNVILITVLLFILWLVSLPMTLGYFRMGTRSIFKFTMIMSFKNILFTFLYVFIMIAPLLLCFINSFFIPIWFLVGISLPLFIIYKISAKKYRTLVNEFESYKDDDIYDLKEDNK